MGWLKDGFYDHEGWAAYVVRDGRLASSSTGGGVLIEREDADKLVRAAHAAGRVPSNQDMFHLVPWDDVVAWQPMCECGWTGRRLERSATMPGQYEGYDASDAYFPDGATAEDRAQDDWAVHLAPLGLVQAIRTAHEDLVQARQRLEDAVVAARTATPAISWEAIGREVGMRKQSAQERWAPAVAHATTAEGMTA